jgi:hypothetical protein
LASKTIKLADVDEFVQKDIKFANVSHVFDLIDNLEVPERGKLRELLGNVLKRPIPIVKSKCAESTGEIVKGLIDMEVIFDTNTTWDDIQNDLFM